MDPGHLLPGLAGTTEAAFWPSPHGWSGDGGQPCSRGCPLRDGQPRLALSPPVRAGAWSITAPAGLGELGCQAGKQKDEEVGESVRRSPWYKTRVTVLQKRPPILAFHLCFTEAVCEGISG